MKMRDANKSLSMQRNLSSFYSIFNNSSINTNVIILLYFQLIVTSINLFSWFLSTTEEQLRIPKRGRCNDAKTKHGKRTNSYPLGRTYLVLSGPWSLEWFGDHNHGDEGAIFSSRKRHKKNS